MPEIRHAGGMDQDVFEHFIAQLDRFVQERLIPAEADVVENNRVPDDILAEMRRLGLFGITIPENYGGSGMNVAQFVETMQHLAYAAPAYRATISIGVGMVTAALRNAGTEAQKSHWLPKLAAGAIAAFGLTEPGTGSDAAGLQTRAVRDGDGYRLNGTKRYISNAPLAEVALIMARTNSSNLPKNAHVSAFVLPMDTAGLRVGKPDAKMGQSGALIADIVLDDVFVPESALLGGVEGEGFTRAMQSLDGGRLSVASAATGYARRALDTALRYATERKAFGEPIANFQLIQAMLADSRAEIYASQCMVADAARLADEGRRVTVESASAKMFASEMCGRVVDRCVQIFGGAGYLSEYPAERFFRDARLYRIYEGTTQILQLVIARNMLKQFAAGV